MMIRYLTSEEDSGAVLRAEGKAARLKSSSSGVMGCNTNGVRIGQVEGAIKSPSDRASWRGAILTATQTVPVNVPQHGDYFQPVSRDERGYLHQGYRSVTV